MLVNGRFVQENPIKIGVYYIPKNKTTLTTEEYFAQEIMLSDYSKINNMLISTRLSKVFLLVCIFILGVAVLAPFIKFIEEFLAE